MNQQGLLIGAYERDNFGDILFLERARDYLGDTPAIATAPFAGDTSGLSGEVVVSYFDRLSGQPVPFVWVLGGATGGTGLQKAAAMANATLGGNTQNVPAYASPYLPRMTRYPELTDTVYVINSVGVAGAAHLSGKARIETESALAEADFLSVRDLASSRYLSGRRIPHHLAPDIVHTIGRTIQPIAPRRDVALVQIKKSLVERYGLDRIAETLARSSTLKNYVIRLFSAGEAPGHDSTELLHSLADLVTRSPRTSDVEVSVARTALEKTAEIANAGLWLGTSLHGFILSTTFAVPRVGLLIDKVRTYAGSWDVDMPTAVGLDSIDDAVSAALDSSDDSMQRDADRLARLAHDNALRALASIDAPYSRGRRRESASATLTALNRMSPRTAALDSALRRPRQLLSRVRSSSLIDATSDA